MKIDYIEFKYIINLNFKLLSCIMYIHSVKVSPIYKVAAKIVEEVKENGGSLKDLVYQQTRRIHTALLALVLKTLQHGSDLDYLIRTTNILHKEPRLNAWLARVLITELLWGKQVLGGESKPVKTILTYQSEFNSLLSKIEPVEKPINQVKKPRYVRVNTLVMTTNQAIDGFRDEGWIFMRHSTESYQDFLDLVTGLTEEQFTVDFHVPDLLIFPPKTRFYNHPCYLDGSLILQDKASCFPALLLNPTPGSVAIDMCAAPGMKTSHLAAIMNNEGTIHAIEQNQRRCQTLSELVKHTGATCVKVINRDALTMTGTELPDVEYILIDPSCSGSGMTDRLSAIDSEEKCAPERLENLAAFQITILRSAFKHFSNAKRIVYSTCSIYPQENEQVVDRVLETSNSFKLVDIKSLLKKEWFNFGSNEYEKVGPKCLYAKSDVDLTNGFFVAVFEKLTEEEKVNNKLNSEKQSKKRKNATENQENEENCQINDKHSETTKKKSKKNKYKLEENIINSEELPNVDSEDKIENVDTQEIEIDETVSKHKKKKKKSKDEEVEPCKEDRKSTNIKDTIENNLNQNTLEVKPLKRKKKSNDNNEDKEHKKHKKHKEDVHFDSSLTLDLDKSLSENTKSKKKKKSKEVVEDYNIVSEEVNIDVPRKKKSKRQMEEPSENLDDKIDSSNVLDLNDSLNGKIKSKKKKKSKEVLEEDTIASEEVTTTKVSKKKKYQVEEINDSDLIETKKKKKKKSKDL